LVGFVIVSDAVLIKIKDRTMSSAFRDAIHHPRRRWPVSISWALLTLHLFTRTKYDPISIAGRLLAAKTPGEVS
jgi:hypothetical protein